MDDDIEGLSFVMGALIMLCFVIIVWHGKESACQEEHNVHDCVFAGFEPREVEDNE